MQIEAHGPEQIMEQIRRLFQDQLEKAGYQEGPKFTSMDAGILISYTREEVIVSIQVTEESETSDSRLRVEAEQDIPGMYELWDAALISYGREVFERLRSFAIDKSKVEKEIR